MFPTCVFTKSDDKKPHPRYTVSLFHEDAAGFTKLISKLVLSLSLKLLLK